MSKVNVIYWSGTGNTKAMADAIVEGAKSAGADVELIEISDASLDHVKNCDVVALGCPAMGAEELEEDYFEPFVESMSDISKDKKMFLFGSYEWADGEWMDEWTERMKSYGANLVVNSLIAYDYPAEEDIEKCKSAGAELAKA